MSFLNYEKDLGEWDSDLFNDDFKLMFKANDSRNKNEGRPSVTREIMNDGPVNFSEHCTLTTTWNSFRSCNINCSEFTDYDCDGVHFKDYFNVTFYVNWDIRNRNDVLASIVHGRPFKEGDVSVLVRGNHQNFGMFSVTFFCVASVIDASGNKRFSQPFGFHHDVLSKDDKLFFRDGFGFDKFLKRSTLLGDSTELLPNDGLTLCLEIDYEITERLIPKYDTDGFDWEDGSWYLRMDTEFARDLCKMSKVFQDMMECPIVESEPGRISIPRKELKSFAFIFAFLSEHDLEVTLTDVCDLYTLADKYDMQRIVQLCHQLLMGAMRAVNTEATQENIWIHNLMISELSELAEKFDDDDSLRGILTIYSDIRNKGGHRERDDSNMETECRLKCTKETFFVPHFVFTKTERENLQMDFIK